VHWQLWGLEKEEWGHVHMMFGGVFIATGALHLYYNWKPFKKYLAEQVQGQLRLSRELVGSLLLSVLLLAAAVWEIPPVSWVFELNVAIKDSWVSKPDLEPPFGHAEEVSVAGLARRMRLDKARGLAALREAGCHFSGERDSLEQIARANHTTPMAVYAVLKRFPLPEEAPATATVMTPEQVEEKYSGSGLGRKTLDEIATQIGMEPDIARQRLRDAGIEAAADETLRELADRTDSSPIDLMKLLLVPGFKPSP